MFIKPLHSIILSQLQENVNNMKPVQIVVLYGLGDPDALYQYFEE